MGGSGPRRLGAPQGWAGGRHHLLRMARELAMEDGVLPSPKAGG